MADEERSYSLRGWEPFTNTDETFQVAEKPSPRGSGIDYVVHDEAGALIPSGWIAGGLTPMQRKKATGTDIGPRKRARFSARSTVLVATVFVNRT
jgi:hypothetical protein